MRQAWRLKAQLIELIETYKNLLQTNETPNKRLIVTIEKYPSSNHWTPDCKMHQDSRLSRCNCHFSPPDSTHEFYVASCFACTCKIRMVALALAHAIGYSGPMESSPSLSTKLCSPFVCNISTLLFQLHSKLLCSNYTKLVLIFFKKMQRRKHCTCTDVLVQPYELRMHTLTVRVSLRYRAGKSQTKSPHVSPH